MELVCISEVNMNYDIILDENIKKMLHPGKKVILRIEELSDDQNEKRQSAIDFLKKMSETSHLGLYKTTIDRIDAHDREYL